MTTTKISCIVMDWAGTAVDYGCFAPLHAFIRMFEEYHINVTLEETRRPMGLPKIDHIREILKTQRVSEQFSAHYRRAWTETDVREMNAKFETYLFATLKDFASPIPRVVETLDRLRAEGIKIGSTTGYTAAMMEIVRKGAAEQGYNVDNLVTPNDVPAGRPAPYMIYKNMLDLKIDSPRKVVKVGDTLADIREGVHAGVWSIGIVEGSNEMGLTEAEFAACDPTTLARLKSRVKADMYAAGADYVLNNIGELPQCIDDINRRLNMQPDVRGRYLLLTPGPLTTSHAVKESMLQDWCTWDEDYNQGVVSVIREKLVRLATGKTDMYTSILLQGSGTYCVEATLGCAVPRDGKLLIAANGAYGKRMVEIADRLGINRTVLTFQETEQVAPEKLEEALAADPSITHVSFVHCETTTGILNPLDTLCPIVKRFEKTLIVDAMSSFGGIPIDTAGLGIDFLVSSANKCIQGVPGFGFVIARTETLKTCQGQARSLSLDLFDQWETMEKGGGKWRFTSPTHVVRAFAQALCELEAEGGIAARHERYKQNQRILSEGMRSLGFRPLLPDPAQSPIITSFLYPDKNFSFKTFYNRLKALGFVIYPGKISQADTFRIGNIGDVRPEDFRDLLDAVRAISE